MRKEYKTWDKNKERLLLCYSNLLGFKPGDEDKAVKSSRAQILDKNKDITKRIGEAEEDTKNWVSKIKETDTHHNHQEQAQENPHHHQDEDQDHGQMKENAKIKINGNTSTDMIEENTNQDWIK